MDFNLKVSKVINPIPPLTNNLIKTKYLYVLFFNIIKKDLNEHFIIKKKLLLNYSLLKNIHSNLPKDIINHILEYLPLKYNYLPSVSYDLNPSISIKKIIYLFCNKYFIKENKINEIIQSINYKNVLTTTYPDKYRFAMTQLYIIRFAFQLIKENLNETCYQHPLIYHLQYYLNVFN